MKMTRQQFKDKLLEKHDLDQLAAQQGIKLYDQSMTLERATERRAHALDGWWVDDVIDDVTSVMKQDFGAEAKLYFNLNFSQGDYAELEAVISPPKDLDKELVYPWAKSLYLAVADLPNTYADKVAEMKEYWGEDFDEDDIQLVLSSDGGRVYNQFEVHCMGDVIGSSSWRNKVDDEMKEEVRQFNRALLKHITEWYYAEMTEEAVREWAEDNLILIED